MKIDDKYLRGTDYMDFDSCYSITQRYIAAIAKNTDYALRHQIIQYAKLKSQEYGEDVQVIFMDEDKVNRIIDLGIREYYRETRGWKNEEE